jgi:hypothetical protein
VMRNTGDVRTSVVASEERKSIVAKTEPNANTTTVSIVAGRKLS